MGGVIALALAYGAPAQTVFDLFLDKGREIFSRPRRLGMLLRPKYDNRILTAALRDYFGSKTLDDALTPVCITSYELENSYPRIWKDDHASDLAPAGDEPAWKVALATCAAPIFFPGTQVLGGDSHVDGGLFANNPALIGLTEAVRYFRQPLERIRILSVGAGVLRSTPTYTASASVTGICSGQSSVTVQVERSCFGGRPGNGQG